MDKQQAEKQYQKAVRLHQSGKYRESEIIYRKLIKAFPQLDSVWTNLGMNLYQQGRFEPALKALDRALSINPTNVDCYNNRAATLLALNRTEDALEAYKMLVQMQPDLAANHYNYANVLFQEGHAQEAENAYREAIRRDANLVPAWFNLAHIFLQDQRLEEAEEHFRRVIALDASYLAGYLNLGNLLTDKGEYEEARRLYQTALDIDPNFAMARTNLARIYIFQSRPAEAKAELEKVLDVQPDHIEALVNYGNALDALGDPTGAKAAYEAALEVAPEFEIARQNLARLTEGTIPPWHFTMLADTGRNQAYREAIEAVVAGKTVLDIGAGSGLLGMMALRAGATKVVGVEVLPELARVAEEIVEKNGYADQMSIVPLHSTALQIGAGLDAPAEVLVSEILDAGLIGEGVLDSHRHAIANLMVDDPIVIPARAEVFAQLLHVPGRRSVIPLREVEGFDLSPMDRFQRMDKLKVLNLSHEEWEGLSMITPLWKVDLKEVPPAATAERPEVFEVEFVAKTEGKVHALAFWFDLWLDDSTMVSSRPGGAVKHWGQAAWFFPEDIPIQVGDSIRVRVIRTDSHWKFEFIPTLP